MSKNETRIFKVGDGNFIVKIAGKDMAILDAGAHAGGSGESSTSVPHLLNVGQDGSKFKELLSGVKNIRTIISHPHKDHVSLLDKVFEDIQLENTRRKDLLIPEIEIQDWYVGGSRQEKFTDASKVDLSQILPKIAEKTSSTIKVHVWESSGSSLSPSSSSLASSIDPVIRRVYEVTKNQSSFPRYGAASIADPAPKVFQTRDRDISFKVGDRLEQEFDSVTKKATILGETFWKGSASKPGKPAFGDKVSLSRERISILTPTSYAGSLGNDAVNEKSLVVVSQFRGMKQVFPGDATGSTLEGVKKAYPNAFRGTDMFITPHHNSRGAVGSPKGTPPISSGQALVMGELATEGGNPDMPSAIAILSTDRSPASNKDATSMQFQKAYKDSMFQEAAVQYSTPSFPAIPHNLLESKKPLNPQADISTAASLVNHRDIVTLTTQKLSKGGRFLIDSQSDGRVGVEISGAGSVNPVSLAGKFTPEMQRQMMQDAKYSKSKGVIVAAFSPKRVGALLANLHIQPKKDTWVPSVIEQPGNVKTTAEMAKEITDRFAFRKQLLLDGIRNQCLTSIRVHSPAMDSLMSDKILSQFKLNSLHHVTASDLAVEDKRNAISKLEQETQSDLYRVIRREQKGIKFEEDNLRSMHKILKKANVLNPESYKLSDFQLSKTRCLTVPSKLEGLFFNLDEVNKAAAKGAVFSELQTPEGKIAFHLKEISRAKKEDTGRLFNLAEPLFDPYIRRDVGTIAPTKPEGPMMAPTKSEESTIEPTKSSTATTQSTFLWNAEDRADSRFDTLYSKHEKMPDSFSFSLRELHKSDINLRRMELGHSSSTSTSSASSSFSGSHMGASSAAVLDQQAQARQEALLSPLFSPPPSSPSIPSVSTSAATGSPILQQPPVIPPPPAPIQPVITPTPTPPLIDPFKYLQQQQGLFWQCNL